MTLKTTLARIGRQSADKIHLVDAALKLAQWTDPDLITTPYQRHVEALVQAAKDFVGPDVCDTDVIIQAVQQIIAKRYGYGAELETDDHAEDSSLAKVIDQRRGAAVLLCILYAHVLEKLGTGVEIVDFPARPMVRLVGLREHIILDPYDGGKRITAAKLRHLFEDDDAASPFSLATFDKRAILVHLLDRRKLFLLRQNAPEAAISVLRAAVLIAPKEARLWRELGVLHARLDHIEDSISALKHFLMLPQADQHRYSASHLLQNLLQRKDPPS